MIFDTIVTAAAPTQKIFARAGFNVTRNQMIVSGSKLLFKAIEYSQPADGTIRVVLNEEEASSESLDSEINERFPTARVFLANSKFEGALASALLACESLVPDRPLLIVAGDSFLRSHVSTYFPSSLEKFGASTIAFRSTNPRWSYLSTNELGQVAEVAEKEVIGSLATTGVFLFSRGQDFIEAAEWVLKNNARTAGRFFVSTALNYFISLGSSVGFTEVSRSEYFSFSTPADFVEQAS